MPNCELHHVLIGQYNGNDCPNPEELLFYLKRYPSWLVTAFSIVLSYLQEQEK